MYECYNRKLVRINLKTRSITEEAVDEYYIRNFIGGMGFGVKLLHEEVDPKVDALSPENKIVISVGPLTGTSAPLFAQTCIVTKSPLTKESGGYFPPARNQITFDTTTHIYC